MNNVVRLLLLSAVPSVFRSLLFASALCMLYADAAHSQWVPTNGPFYMHATYSLVTSRSNAGITLFAGTQRGLVYRTTDNGNTWIRTDGRDPTSLDTGFANRDVGSLVVSRGYLFAGTTPYGSGIFRLAVNDTHWIAVNNGLTNLNVWRLMAYADGAGDTALYVGTGGGIFRSTDNGGSWVARNVGLTDLAVGALAYTTHDSGQSTFLRGHTGVFTFPLTLANIGDTWSNRRMRSARFLLCASQLAVFWSMQVATSVPEDCFAQAITALIGFPSTRGCLRMLASKHSPHMTQSSLWA